MYDRVLGIDTAGRTLAVGLFIDGKPSSDIRVSEPFQHSRLLVSAVNDILVRAGCSLDTIDLLGVSRGPGSYTGLRLGATAAKVLGWSVGAPVIGVDALSVIAHNVPSGLVVACLPARRGEIYARAYGSPSTDDTHGFRSPLLPLLEGKIETVLSQIVAKLPDDPIILVGEGVRGISDEINQILGDRASLASPQLDQPQGSTVARMARKLAADHSPVDPIQFTPLYAGPQVVRG